MWFISSNTSGEEHCQTFGRDWWKYSSHHLVFTQNNHLDLTSHHGGSGSTANLHTHTHKGFTRTGYSSEYLLLKSPYCHTITGRNQNTGGSPVFWAAWLMDDRCNCQQRKVQRIREKLKLPINHFPRKHWTRIQKEHRKKKLSLIIKKVKRIKHAQKSGAHLSVGQTKDFFPVHCPHSESQLCFFICSAQISLKFNCIKTPQRLSEVSLCKLQLLQLYRRLVVKVEAHLKLKCTWQRLKLRPLLHSLFWERWHHPSGSFQRERSALPGTFSYTAWLNLQK